MLTLYFAPGSSSMAVHIALCELGVSFERKPMSFRNNDLRSPEYLALNPEGKVPTLVIDGRPLTEVGAILYFLAKRFPKAELLPPDDIEADARALSWMSFAASTCIPHAGRASSTRTRFGALPTVGSEMGGDWRVFHCGHPPLSAALAFRPLAWTGGGTVSKPRAAPRAHDGPPAVRQTIEIEAAIGDELPA